VTVLFHTVLFVHFLGLAALIGGALGRLPKVGADAPKVTDAPKVDAPKVDAPKVDAPKITVAMLYGALTQLVTGLALWGIVKSGLHQDVPTAKMIVKLGVLVVILGALWSERAKERVADGLLYFVLGLAAAEVAVAVFWT
jgi:hypothetical protein